MEGWKEYKINDLILKSYQRDPRKKPEEYFKYVDVSSVSRENYSIADYTITKGENAPSRARKIIQKNDMIFATVRPTLMRIALVPEEFHNEICSTGYCVLKPNTDLITPAFLYYSVLPDYFISKIGKLQRGASYPAIRDADLKNQKIIVPPLPEQRKIAHILSTIQKAIEQQDKLIKTTTELKKALMQKLFTEGLPEFRRRAGLYGEKQKETEIGPVPESWDVVKFPEFCLLQRGKDLTKKNFKKGNIPVAGSSGIIGFHNQSFVKAPGVTVGRSGSCGNVCLYELDFWAHNTALYVKDFKGNSEIFTYYYLQYLDLGKFKTGVSVPTLDRNSLNTYLVAVPRKSEQISIAGTIKKIESKIEHHQKKKQTLTDLFKTLLNELMTGQRRVNKIDFENEKEELLMAAEPEIKYNE